MQSMTIDSAAIRLTDTILGYDEPDLEQALKAIAANIGVLHISYVPLSSEKSEDAKLLSAICTYPVAWQARYFRKQYARIDPVIARGSEAVLPFDWDELPKDDPAVREFLDDAIDHDRDCAASPAPGEFLLRLPADLSGAYGGRQRGLKGGPVNETTSTRTGRESTMIRSAPGIYHHLRSGSRRVPSNDSGTR